MKLKEARNVLTYLESSREHKRLREMYWPTSNLSSEEKLKRTANVVGFNLPKKMEDGDFKEPEQLKMGA